MPESITCREFIEFLDAYIDGSVTPERKTAFEAHLAECSHCRAYLDEYRATVRLARSLGTPVEDHYVFRHGASGWQAVLVEERWVGEGYGLPIAAGPGETLVRDHSLGSDGWKLTLQRPVHPLVVLALPSQRMRVLVDGQAPVLLGGLGPPAPTSVALQVEGCPTRAAS